MTYDLNRRAVLLGGLGLAGGVALAGCSSGGSSTSAGTSGGATTAPKRGGTLRMAVQGGNAGDPADPATAKRTLPLAIAVNCYDTLTFADEDYKLSPWLATEWTSNSDATQWTFTLRDGVTFHDGSALTSKDVAYSFTRVLDPKLGAAALATIKAFVTASGIATPDAKTVKFTLAQPNGFFPVLVSAATLAIVKDGTTDFSKGNGTGAFTITSFDPAARLSLKRNDSYWRSGLPYLDGVEYVVIADPATRLQSLTAGSQDVVDNITGAATKLLVGNLVPVQIKAGGWVGLTMFRETAPFDNPQVVQAMQYAADRSKIMSVVAPGIDLITPDIPIPPSDPFYPSGMQPKAYDPDKAKSLLQQAGHSGLSVEFTAYPGDKLDTVTTYQSTAAAAGIDVKINNVPSATFFSDAFLKKPAIGISVARLHISQALPRIYGSSGDLNLTHYKDPKLDQLLQSAVATADASVQKQRFQDALTLINDNATNVIPGWEGQVYGTSKKVAGLRPTNGAQVYQHETRFV